MTHNLWLAAAVAAARFATALLSSIAGFGGGVLLMPVFVAVSGPRDLEIVGRTVRLNPAQAAELAAVLKPAGAQHPWPDEIGADHWGHRAKRSRSSTSDRLLWPRRRLPPPSKATVPAILCGSIVYGRRTYIRASVDARVPLTGSAWSTTGTRQQRRGVVPAAPVTVWCLVRWVLGPERSPSAASALEKPGALPFIAANEEYRYVFPRWRQRAHRC